MPMYRCSECGNRITVGPSGTEYGHQRGIERGRDERCPLRPDCVDPTKPARNRAQLPPTVRGLLVLAIGLAAAVAIAALEGGVVT